MLVLHQGSKKSLRTEKTKEETVASLIDRGFFYSEKRQRKKAIRCYRKALEIDEECALAHFNLGCLLDDQGLKDMAIICYLRALQIQPDYADVHYNLGLKYQDTKEYAKALKHLELFLKYAGADPHRSIAESQIKRLLPLVSPLRCIV